MPTYSYQCPLEHDPVRIIRGINEERPKYVKCPCGRKATRVFRHVNAAYFEPYITYVGDGEPKMVRNTADANDIEKIHKVAELGSAEFRKMSDPDELRKRRERRAAEARASLEPMKQTYEKAEAEVKQWGKEYHKEFQEREQHEFEQFEREAKHANY